MTATLRCVPVPGRSHKMDHGGRTFLPTTASVDLAPGDGGCGYLSSNGWAMLRLRGSTLDRPKEARPASPYIDTDLGAVLFALVWPTGSGKVVGWCDMTGAVV
jgi:hypothetical protein